MRRITLGTFLLFSGLVGLCSLPVVALAPAAAAYETRSDVNIYATWDRTIVVTARYAAPSGCYRIADVHKEESVPFFGNMPNTTEHYTVLVEKQGGRCARGATVLEKSFITYSTAYHWWLKLTFVDARGRVLKTERFGVTGH